MQRLNEKEAAAIEAYAEALHDVWIAFEGEEPRRFGGGPVTVSEDGTTIRSFYDLNMEQRSVSEYKNIEEMKDDMFFDTIGALGIPMEAK